ncbi:unnamed protein product [Ceratitis capitata]|uniref:(Mediterranean fruit fly) hypothetical protein n=1 Tax=Ceratitis capitata TaxID=7213 RepID=A0A811UME0_CERCA|nr:unnamed protein product [Ceratitis capitata]
MRNHKFQRDCVVGNSGGCTGGGSRGSGIKRKIHYANTDAQTRIYYYSPPTYPCNCAIAPVEPFESIFKQVAPTASLLFIETV